MRTCNQRGDTIVEVLLAMSVVGLVLTSSFGIANRSLNIGRSAQERTTALKIAESQLELMKYLKASAATQTAAFCVNAILNPPVIVVATNTQCIGVNGSGGPGLYTISIARPATPDPAYEITVSWVRLDANIATPDDFLTLYYKLGAL